MAKKKKRTTRKKAQNQAPQHALPAGFWSQVGAVALIALSILLVVAWFGVGGPVLDWLQSASLSTIGYATYAVPLLATYVAVEVFRAEKNKLPFVMKFASILLLVWFAGLFGLLKAADGTTTGGFVGDTANSAMLQLVQGGVAAFVYVLLIIFTILFVLRLSPMAIITWLREILRTQDFDEQKANVEIMKKAANKNGSSSDVADHEAQCRRPDT